MLEGEEDIYNKMANILKDENFGATRITLTIFNNRLYIGMKFLCLSVFTHNPASVLSSKRLFFYFAYDHVIIMFLFSSFFPALNRTI